MKADTSVTIQPSRVMTYAEAVAVPPVPSIPEPTADSLTSCLRLTEAQFPPAGMPATRLCYQVVELDMDGNGKPDRLVTWRPRAADLFTTIDPRLAGAVVYLDDGTFHLLEDKATGWGDNFEQMSVFSLRSVAYLGADAKAVAFIHAVVGSNTMHSVVLALTDDRRLRRVRTDDGSMWTVSLGGGANAESRIGCVRSQGRPLVAEFGTNSVFGDPPAFEWGTNFSSYRNGVLTPVGARSGTVASESEFPDIGAECTSAEVSGRGPEIGPLG